MAVAISNSFFSPLQVGAVVALLRAMDSWRNGLLGQADVFCVVNSEYVPLLQNLFLYFSLFSVVMQSLAEHPMEVLSLLQGHLAKLQSLAVEEPDQPHQELLAVRDDALDITSSN